MKSEEVIHLFSFSVVEELINKGESDITTVEQRNKVLTVTNGEYTLGLSAWFPPDC